MLWSMSLRARSDRWVRKRRWRLWRRPLCGSILFVSGFGRFWGTVGGLRVLQWLWVGVLVVMGKFAALDTLRVPGGGGGLFFRAGARCGRTSFQGLVWVVWREVRGLWELNVALQRTEGSVVLWLPVFLRKWV